MIPPHKQNYNIIRKGDSKASNHYFAINDKSTLLDVRLNNPPTTTTLSDHSTLQSTLQRDLPIKNLPTKATNTKLFNNLNHSLISLG